MIPLWLKIACTGFLGVLVPVNWRQYGPANFLWFSDIAMFMLAPGLWFESPLLISMASLAVLLPEIAWNLDFVLRLLRGRRVIGLSDYMFDSRIPLAIRSVSLFHVWLPVVLVWSLQCLGYDGRALLWQSMLAFVVVPLSWKFGTPEENVNWVYGWGGKPQTVVRSAVFMMGIMIGFPLLIYLPTHLILLNVFAR